MSKPRLLDLFCGAGGAAVGYARAGFEVVGVDIEPQPNYPFDFEHADALEVLEEGYPWLGVRGYARWDAVHASPPCQAHTAAQTRKHHDDLVTPTLALLREVELPWIVENVPGAPLRGDLVLSGCQFGLGTEDGQLCRPRLFELGNWSMFDLRPPCAHVKRRIPVFGHNPNKDYYERHGRGSSIAERREAMGIDWMTREELAQAIPPVFTEYIGAQLLSAINDTAGSVQPPAAERGAVVHIIDTHSAFPRVVASTSSSSRETISTIIDLANEGHAAREALRQLAVEMAQESAEVDGGAG